MRTSRGDKKKIVSSKFSKIRGGGFRTIRGVKYFRRLIGPPPLRGSFFLENGTLRDTREKNPEIGSKNVTPSLF